MNGRIVPVDWLAVQRINGKMLSAHVDRLTKQSVHILQTEATVRVILRLLLWFFLQVF